MAKILKKGLKSRIPGIWRPARGGFYINPSRRGPAVPGGGWLGSPPREGCPRAPGKLRRGLPGTPGPGDPPRFPGVPGPLPGTGVLSGGTAGRGKAPCGRVR